MSCVRAVRVAKPPVSDGLLDGDEVKTFKTNPLKYDTYGLGHSDSWGVQHGVILPGGKIDRSKLPKT